MNTLFLTVLLLSDTLHLNLHKAVQLAIEQNPSLKADRSQALVARLDYWNSVLSYGVSPTLSYSQIDTMPSSQSFNLSFTLFSPTQAGMVVNAHANAVASQYSLRRSENSMILSVEKAYLGVLSAQKTVEARRKQLKRAEENLRFVKSSYELGNASRLDLMSARVQVGQAKLNLTESENAYRDAVAQLALVLGLPPQTPIICEDVEMEIDTALPDVDSLVKIAVNRRPDLLSMRRTLRSRKVTTAISVLSFLPQVTYNMEWNRQDGGEWSKSSPKRYISLQFDPLSYPFRIAESISQLRQTELEYRAAYLQTVKEVRSTYDQFLTTYRSYQLSMEVLEQAKLAYELAREKYHAGEIGILELFRAESDYADAEAQAASAKYQLYIARLELDYILGRAPIAAIR